MVNNVIAFWEQTISNRINFIVIYIEYNLIKLMYCFLEFRYAIYTIFLEYMSIRHEVNNLRENLRIEDLR